jgi:hypothetical protein
MQEPHMMLKPQPSLIVPHRDSQVFGVQYNTLIAATSSLIEISHLILFRKDSETLTGSIWLLFDLHEWWLVGWYQH